MAAEAVTWVDVEGAVRAWARDVVASAERRVFFGANDKAGYPQIVLSRIGGPDDNCLIQFDVWGATKDVTAATAAELAEACDGLSRYDTGSALLHGAGKADIRWLPDPESDRPRHVVTVPFTATASTPGS